MPTQMIVADLRLVPADHPRAQKVAVLNGPFDVSIAYAEIPEAGDGEVRVRMVLDGLVNNCATI